ncbi:MAG: ABC transporter substrate-binding protein [Clostridia bacterium]|nr:ABC transporter substrate-binding protein [Clostridia bacterium]MBQ5957196.1 ABC transporter substrate-binding protein [Clostridia bacterium]MBQ6003849.1 ABC transporter substrate-binding protein [Clostridia bacterium]MBR0439062.1 ABC transporter substrate-binding protein [Clostridia bacterium]
MKKIISFVIAVMMLLAVVSGCKKEQTPSSAVPSKESSSVVSSSQVPSEPVSSEIAEKAHIRFGILKGPTGIGASYLLKKNEEGTSLNEYEVSLAAEATDLVSQVAAGKVDISAIPTNVASSLYNKTEGEVKILALNTAGVLYILENGDTVKSVSDLKGKKIYAVGQGSNPEYVLNYILTENGLDPAKDVEIEFLDSAELVTKMAAGDVKICMLPVPAVTTVLIKNQDVKIALNLTEEWSKVNSDSKLIMGCVVVRKEFLEQNPKAVEDFLKEYEESINYVKDNPKEAGELCEKYEIVPAAAVATKAIPDCNLIFAKGDEMKEFIEGYYEVLFKADPKSIGGKIPGEDFYTTFQ